MKKPDIYRLLDFHKLLNSFAGIERMIHVKRGEDYILESDTEHSYNLTMTAWFLAQYFPSLDRDKLIRFALIHDLVEVHAGDTYIYGSETELKSKPQREKAALKRLQREWPDFSELTTEISSYEQLSSEEAKFIYALDKIMPIMAIYLAEGHSWRQMNITLEKLHASKNSKVALSKEIKRYYKQLYDLLQQNPHLFGKS